MISLNNYMRKTSLRITKANIKNGEQANPGKCPIANSIVENIRNVTFVSVLPDQATIKVKKGNKIQAYKSALNNKAKTFIKNFDDGETVNPFFLTFNFKKISREFAELV